MPHHTTTRKLITLGDKSLQGAPYFTVMLKKAAKGRGKQVPSKLNTVLLNLLRRGGIRGVSNDQDEIKALEASYYPLFTRFPLYSFNKRVQKHLALVDPNTYAALLRRMLERILFKKGRLDLTELKGFSRGALKTMTVMHPTILHGVGRDLFPKRGKRKPTTKDQLVRQARQAEQELQRLVTNRQQGVTRQDLGLGQHRRK